MIGAAQAIVQALHGKWRGTYGVVRCPAHDDRSPSLRLREGDAGVPLVRCFAGCDSRDVIVALSRIGVWPERDRSQPIARRPAKRVAACPTVYQRQPWTDSEAARVRFARDCWLSTVPASGTIVETYWRVARGLSLSIPPVIRFGAAIPMSYPDPATPPRVHPAMVAKVQGPDGRFVGIHATYLLPDGSGKYRNTKLIFGCVGSAAIRLSDAACHICIGEGIETTASYIQETAIPGWVGMNTSGLRSIVLPPLQQAYHVTLLGENDENGASAAATTAAGSRMRLEGRTVDTVWPADGFKDFNDPLKMTVATNATLAGESN